jgi:hypothetical protein
MTEFGLRAQNALRAVVLYDNRDSATRAQDVCDQFSQQGAGRYTFEQTHWKFELLHVPALRALAAEETRDADFVLVTIRGQGELPAEVRAWVEEWLSQPGPRPRALLALIGPEKDPGCDFPQAELDLQAMAARAAAAFWVLHADATTREWPPPRLADSEVKCVVRVALKRPERETALSRD